MIAPATAAARMSAPVLRACMSCSECCVEARRRPDCLADRSPGRRPCRARPRRSAITWMARIFRAARPGSRGLGRQQRERFGQQSVAGQDRHALAVDDVVRRPAAPQRIVIHRRKVVVDERVGMDELDRTGRRQRRRDRLFGIARCAGDGFGSRERRMGRSRLPPASRL